MTRILVTGGAGFIGSNFVQYTLEHFPEAYITVLDSLTYAGNRENLLWLENEYAGKLDFVYGSINDADLVDSVMCNADVVVHFAAETHNDRAIIDPDIFIKTNVAGTMILLQSALKYGVRFHHISTDEVYGDMPIDSDKKFTERSPYNPSNPYSASKAASDHLVRAWSRTYGLFATISNCSNNLGPRQHIEKFIPRMITNVISGLPVKIYGDGSAIRDWIYVTDQCSAIWKILQRGEKGKTYLIGADNAYSNLFIARRVLTYMESCGFTYEIEYVRDRLGADRKYAIDSTAIKNELGWIPSVDMDAAIAKTVDWYIANEHWWRSLKESVENEYAKNKQ